MAENTSPHPFVAYLETLVEDRAALAALRRGLGQPPGTVAEMYPYVVPRLPRGANRSEEDAYYALAALFGFHPSVARTGNLGDHLARTIAADADRAAVERRFVALLKAHPEDLAGQLRQAISFLKSKEVPVNWSQLLLDMCAWDHPQRYVQRRWANAFWGTPNQSTDSQANEE